MLHDSDLIDTLVALCQAQPWSVEVADIRRVWGGDVTEAEIPTGRAIVQLWPDSQRHNRSTGRAAPWSLQVAVGVMFAVRLQSSTIAEVDAWMRSFDELLISDTAGLGSTVFDQVTVTTTRGLGESALFVRAPSMEWPVRPNIEKLQRLAPEGDGGEQYTGLLHTQAIMTYDWLR